MARQNYAEIRAGNYLKFTAQHDTDSSRVPNIISLNSSL